MWANETANDLYGAGVDDDEFVLVSNSNKECTIAVKNPWGTVSKRITMNNLELQGSVLAPIKCSIQVDTLGRDIMKDIKAGERLFRYKDCLKIPPMSLIDDIITVTKC